MQMHVYCPLYCVCTDTVYELITNKNTKCNMEKRRSQNTWWHQVQIDESVNIFFLLQKFMNVMTYCQRNKSKIDIGQFSPLLLKRIK